jgi:uncharacterized membrane protein YbhN (UPF0104 family)
MKKLLTSTLKFLVFFGIGSTILYLVYRSQNAAYLEQCAIDGIPEADCNLLLKVWTDIKNANYFWIGMILLAYTISNISRTERWMMLIKPMGYQPRWLNGFGTVMLGYFANLGLPRMGEVIRAGVFSKYENIPPEKVMGTVVTDRIVDFICFFIVIGCAFLLEFDTLYNFVAEQRNAANAEAGGTSWIEILLWVGGSLALVCGLLLLVFFRKIKETNIYKKVLNILEGFAEGIQTIKNLDRPGLFVFHSVMIWIMYFLMLYLGTFSFAPTTELGLCASLVIFTAGSLAAWDLITP